MTFRAAGFADVCSNTEALASAGKIALSGSCANRAIALDYLVKPRGPRAKFPLRSGVRALDRPLEKLRGFERALVAPEPPDDLHPERQTGIVG